MTLKPLLEELFQDLNNTIKAFGRTRIEEGAPVLRKARVRLLGQVSLLINDRVSMILALAQTGDLDAHLTMEHIVKAEFKKLLIEHGLVYDEDSDLIWIPPGARFEPLFDFEFVLVEAIDPESALVSKAVKAPTKNKQLIRQAIASDVFPRLVDRILENGGRLEDFT